MPTAETEPSPQKKAYQSTKLMKAMGAPSFNPIPPAQHQWQQGKDQPLLHRIWSWMCAHTIDFPCRSPYAIDNQRDGNDLYIEHCTRDLEADEANVRRAWRDGVQRGLWRNGTAAEGKRRLYLCGTVTPQTPTPDPEEDPEKSLYKPLPAYISKQTKDWPKEKQEQFRAYYCPFMEITDEAEALAIAEAVAIIRGRFRDHHDAGIRQWGIEANRQEHKNGKSPEEAAARAARATIIEPRGEKFVQTFFDYVQSTKTAVYNGSVQSPESAASLLPQRTTREGPEAGGRDSGNGSSSRSESPVPVDGKKSVQLPAERAAAARAARPQTQQGKALHAEPEKPPVKPATEEERERVRICMTIVNQAQQQFPHAGQGEQPMRMENEGDFIHLLVNVVRVVPPAAFSDDAEDPFGPHIIAGYAKLNQNALGKGPHPIKLLGNWARDFVATTPLRASARQLAREREEKRQSLETAARASQERELAMSERLDAAWTALSEEDRAGRMAIAEQDARKDHGSQWNSFLPQRRRAEMESRARQTLRREIEAADQTP